jgi:NTP pyrophosphatase (non-canonical NTP hydrolase)
MTPEHYQATIAKNAFYKDRMVNDLHIPYLITGLAGEAGEVADKVKKEIRTNGCAIGLFRSEDFAKELGDTLWYLTMLAGETGYSLREIMQINLDKITGRINRGTLEGNGDNR